MIGLLQTHKILSQPKYFISAAENLQRAHNYTGYADISSLPGGVNQSHNIYTVLAAVFSASHNMWNIHKMDWGFKIIWSERKDNGANIFENVYG